MSALEAARLGDRISHTGAWFGFRLGAILGAIIGGAIAIAIIVGATVLTGGLAAVAFGALFATTAAGMWAGEHIGSAAPRTLKGQIAQGSPNTFVGDRQKGAARAGIDYVLCEEHTRKLLAEGSETVYVNGWRFTRKTERTVCDGKIEESCPTVIVGGATVGVVEIEGEIPPWARNLQWALGWGGLILLTGGSFAVYGFWTTVFGIGFGYAGGHIGQWALGGIARYFGAPEIVVRIAEVVGNLGGSFGAGYGGSRLGSILDTAAVGRPPLTRTGPFTQRQLQAQARQAQMLNDNVGYNVSPRSWDSYPTIGRNGSFISDAESLSGVLGDLPASATNARITPAQARTLEANMGLETGSLANGFKVRRIEGISERTPFSPGEGNQYFQGRGRHLPGGAPEMVIDSVPTVDGPGVSTILNVSVGPAPIVPVAPPVPGVTSPGGNNRRP